MGVVLSHSSQPPNSNTHNTPSDFKRPRFYQGREGPCYSTLDFNKRYETRHLTNPTMWVSTMVTGTFKDAMDEGELIIPYRTKLPKILSAEI